MTPDELKELLEKVSGEVRRLNPRAGDYSPAFEERKRQLGLPHVPPDASAVERPVGSLPRTERGTSEEAGKAPEGQESPPRASIAVKNEKKSERETQNEFLAWLEHHRDRLYWIAVRPDRKSTVRVGHPDVSIWGRKSRYGDFGDLGPSSLLIEFKTEIGKLSDDQKEVHRWLNDLRCVQICVCRSSAEAIAAVKAHFGI